PATEGPGAPASPSGAVLVAEAPVDADRLPPDSPPVRVAPSFVARGAATPVPATPTQGAATTTLPLLVVRKVFVAAGQASSPLPAPPIPRPLPAPTSTPPVPRPT